ncbi:hypothetical protein MWU59_10475 [Flavobacteriaceae bacterium F08102]|nr:hypothetical protein [Flavobacteriaceae bacterium F08102]
MKKSFFTLIALLVFALLIALFINSGVTYSQDETPTLIWSSGRFNLADTSKVIGALIILWFPVFLILRKRIQN